MGDPPGAGQARPVAPAPPMPSPPPSVPPPPRTPQPTTAATAPITDIPGYILKRATELQRADQQHDSRKKERGRDDVLNELKALRTQDLDTVQENLIATLEHHLSLRQQGIELLRMIGFIQHPPPPSHLDTLTIRGGAVVKLKAARLSNGANVTATKNSVSSLTGEAEGYSLTYSGPNDALVAQDCRWLQMIWRDAVLIHPAAAGRKERGVATRRRIADDAFPETALLLTTDPDRAHTPEVCRWHADTAQTKTSDHPSPFYDTKIRGSDSDLTMFAAPLPTIDPGAAQEYFAAADPPITSIVSGFHAETFLVQGIRVLYRVTVDITWTQTKGHQDPKPDIKITGDQVTHIRAEQRARLALQTPDYTWLPGPMVSPPLRPDSVFDRVHDVTNSAWAHNHWLPQSLVLAPNLSILAQQANIGEVEILRSTYPADQIITGPPYRAGLSVIQAGSKDSKEGNTAFISSEGIRNVKLGDRKGPLPRVSIIISISSLKDGITRDHGVTVLRHEMRHAAGYGYALGWLTRWLDDFTSTDFAKWFSDQPKSDDFHSYVTPLHPNGSSAEVLSHTEGFLAGVPFLPATPMNSAVLGDKNTWPPALDQLNGLLADLDVLEASSQKNPKKKALDLVREFMTGMATQAERNSLTSWLAAVTDPTSVRPELTPDQIKTINESFNKRLPGFVKEVKDIASTSGRP